MSETEITKGKLNKVLFFDDNGQPLGQWKSNQVPEDLFDGRMGPNLQEPPFPLEQLVFLAESHPIHSSAIEQKASDVIGTGWEWVTKDDNADEGQRDELEEWLEGLADEGEQTTHELLSLAWQDFETTGQGFLELVRDTNGVIRQWFHVPAHTCRFHRDGVRIAQVRMTGVTGAAVPKIVWFQRWGAPLEEGKYVNKNTGAISSNVPEDKRATELFVIQKLSRRSTWYGIPEYISSTGWISLALAARDDNLMFFANRREPRWAVILENLEDDPGLEEALRQAFKVDLKQPYRNIILPISGPGKVTFQKLSNDRMDGTFANLSDRSDAAILVAHRMPPERLGLNKVGPLGGNVTVAASLVYKEGVISPRQALLAARMNRFIQKEYPKQAQAKALKRMLRKDAAPANDEASSNQRIPWIWSAVERDLGEDRELLEQATMKFKNNLCTLNEARAMLGMGPLMMKVMVVDPDWSPETRPAQYDDAGNLLQPEVVEDEDDAPMIPKVDKDGNFEEELDPRGDMLYSEIANKPGVDSGPGSTDDVDVNPQEGRGNTPVQPGGPTGQQPQANEELENALTEVREGVRELLFRNDS